MKKDRTKSVIDELKRLSARKAYRLRLIPEENVSVYASKLGGAPYTEKGEAFPVDSEGKAMPFLCQLNLADIGKTGLLQFFISGSGKTECRVLYRQKAENAAEAECVPCGEFSPVKRECAIELEEFTDCIGVSDVHFDSLLKNAVENVLGAALEDMYSFFSEDECAEICSELSGSGHKLFGYPCFTQFDYRKEDTNEILLLQIDSEFCKNEVITMWGDCGVGNFFITQADLDQLDFTEVTYNWDCY